MEPKEVRRESMPCMSSAQLESLSHIEESDAFAPTGYPPPLRERPTRQGHGLGAQGMAWATPSRENGAVCGASPPGVRVVPLASTKEGRRSSNLMLPSDAQPPAMPSTREPSEAEASLSPSTTRSAPPLQCVSSSLSSLGLQPTAAAEPSGATCRSPAPPPAAMAPHETGAASPSADAVPLPLYTPSTLKIRLSLDARLAAHIHSPTSPAAAAASSSAASSSSAAASTAATSAAASAASAASTASAIPAAFPGQQWQHRAPPPTGAASAETAGEAERAKQRASERARNAAPPSPLRRHELRHELRRQRPGAWAEDGAASASASASASAPRLRRDLLGRPPQPQPQLHLGPATSALGEGGDAAEAAKRVATEYAKQVGIRIEHEQQLLRAEWRAERAAMRAASLRSLAPVSTHGVGGEKAGADEPRAVAPSAAPGGGLGSISSPRSAARDSPREEGTATGAGGKGEPKRRQAWLATLLKPEHRAHRVGVG